MSGVLLLSWLARNSGWMVAEATATKLEVTLGYGVGTGGVKN
jgi:hypothetical protein